MKTETIQFMPKLSAPGKMPCPTFSTPAQACKTGSKLAKVPGSVCHGCYALKGNYRFPNVKAPREHNLSLLQDLPSWQAMMIKTIAASKHGGYFRWHDSGDVQSFEHLLAIIAIAHALPEIRFWLPTKEKALLIRLTREGINPPANLTIRLSMAMIDQGPINSAWPTTSTVHTGQPFGQSCMAYTQGGKCGDCRACWNPSVPNISYPKH